MTQAAWGTHELVVAARSLLEAAFSDPMNERFIMLSESGIPLYPAATVYSQLMSEEKSRINACGIGVGPADLIKTQVLRNIVILPSRGPHSIVSVCTKITHLN